MPHSLRSAASTRSTSLTCAVQSGMLHSTGFTARAALARPPSLAPPPSFLCSASLQPHPRHSEGAGRCMGGCRASHGRAPGGSATPLESAGVTTASDHHHGPTPHWAGLRWHGRTPKDGLPPAPRPLSMLCLLPEGVDVDADDVRARAVRPGAAHLRCCPELTLPQCAHHLLPHQIHLRGRHEHLGVPGGRCTAVRVHAVGRDGRATCCHWGLSFRSAPLECAEQPTPEAVRPRWPGQRAEAPPRPFEHAAAPSTCRSRICAP